MTIRDEYGLMSVEDEMRLKAYSAYVRRQGLDPLEYHSKAIDYLEGESEMPPLAWDQAMELLQNGDTDE